MLNSEELAGKNVVIVGMGYVGLPTALSLADHGATVVGYDISGHRLQQISDGNVDLLDRDRDRLDFHGANGGLLLTKDPTLIANADAVVICVPTGINTDLSPALGPLTSACSTVVEHARAGQVIVLTSTTYVGCTRELLATPLALRGLHAGTNVSVVFSPERINPGVEAHAPERTPRVLGGVTMGCSHQASTYLAHTAGGLHTVSSLEAAEMTKLLENSYRAVNISFINEFADAASELDVDVLEVITAASTKPYGFQAFYPGPGIGGHCVSCDPHYLLWQLRTRRIPAPVLSTVMTAVAHRPKAVATKALEVLGGISRRHNARVLVVGVAYKPGVADVREAPALEIMDELEREGVQVHYYDPLVPALDTHTGVRRTGVLDPAPLLASWDLVLVHTLHPGYNYGWLKDAFYVLDTTYSLDLPNSVTL